MKAIFMKAIGFLTKNMGLVNKYLAMETYTMECGEMERWMDSGNIHSILAMYMMENSRTTWNRVEADYTLKLVVTFMLDNGIKTKWLEMEYMNLLKKGRLIKVIL
jgi:hypothetical protein